MEMNWSTPITTVTSVLDRYWPRSRSQGTILSRAKCIRAGSGEGVTAFSAQQFPTICASERQRARPPVPRRGKTSSPISSRPLEIKDHGPIPMFITDACKLS
ncbi:uncharacterized protein LOC122534192 isoform X2 [Frieseomelitta varia]|uniref:uncharacterized protein LOC122534192 isoform X2 n=1 Tax=Frieseomelitta varia TaxID=561572 RepID=UPI001CB69F18|nr:uncharacterized protein LOC122534192 isoform X2 [Frieseomelitta varia]